MKELKYMNDQELSNRIVDYIDRIQNLMDRVSHSINQKTQIDKDSIRTDYKEIKNEIKNDAHYVNLSRNDESISSLYTAFFTPSISEASAWGFTAPTNSPINSNLFDALEEAHYKLTKYNSYEQWKKFVRANVID